MTKRRHTCVRHRSWWTGPGPQRGDIASGHIPSTRMRRGRISSAPVTARRIPAGTGRTAVPRAHSVRRVHITGIVADRSSCLSPMTPPGLTAPRVGPSGSDVEYYARCVIERADGVPAPFTRMRGRVRSRSAPADAETPALRPDLGTECGCLYAARDQRTRMYVTLPIHEWLRYEVPDDGEPASYIMPSPA